MTERIRYDQRYLSLPEVYRLGSFSAAGTCLALTPSAVAQQIHSIERELNITLFRKGDRRLVPTPECETVIKYIKQIQSLCRRMEEEIDRSRQRLRHLVVGVTPSAESFALSTVLTRYAERSPALQITVNTGPAAGLCTMLKSPAIDLAGGEGDFPCEDCNSILLDTDFLTVAVPPDSSYAKKGMITVKELQKEPLILKPPGSGTRCLLEAKLKSAGLSMEQFHVMMEVDSIATIQKLVASRYGLSVLSSKACRKAAAAGKICTVPLDGMNMVRKIQLLYRKDFHQETLLRDIQQCYAEIMRESPEGQAEIIETEHGGLHTHESQ